MGIFLGPRFRPRSFRFHQDELAELQAELKRAEEQLETQEKASGERDRALQPLGDP